MKYLVSRPLSAAHHMLLATLFFSLMEVFVKFLSRIPTMQIVFFRAAVAMVICLIILKKQKIKFFGTYRLLLSLRGVFGTAALILYFYSIKNMPLASAATIQKLSPVFTVLFAALFREERFHPKTWLYFLLAMIGAAVIKGVDTQFAMPIFLLALLSAVASGMAYNCIAELKHSEHPLVIILYFPLVTLPLVTPSTIHQWVSPTAWEWCLLVAIGVVVQTAQYFMTVAYQRGQTAQISVIYYLGTVLAALYGWTLFEEIPSLNIFIGMTLIIFAVVQIQRLPQPEPAKN